MAELKFFLVAPKKGDMPFAPYLHIHLSEHSSDSEGHILLSPQLMTDKEIDESVDLLVMQLEKVRKTAKLKLKKAMETSIRHRKQHRKGSGLVSCRTSYHPSFE